MDSCFYSQLVDLQELSYQILQFTLFFKRNENVLLHNKWLVTKLEIKNDKYEYTFFKYKPVYYILCVSMCRELIYSTRERKV